MPTPLRPNTELVAVALLQSLDGMPASAVATTLPEDGTGWQAAGFVTVGPVSGGGVQLYTHTRRPVVSVHCWANAGQSGKPPWNKAAQLGEIIVAGALGFRPTGVTMPAGYGAVKVLGLHTLTEPRRFDRDQASYAHYQLDAEIDWVAL